MFNFVFDSFKGEIFDFKVNRRVLVASTVLCHHSLWFLVCYYLSTMATFDHRMLMSEPELSWNTWPGSQLLLSYSSQSSVAGLVFSTSWLALPKQEWFSVVLPVVWCFSLLSFFEASFLSLSQKISSNSVSMILQRQC